MEETIIRKVQPHSVEAEQAVLASMLMNREAVVNVADMLMKDDFYQVLGDVYKRQVWRDL